MKYYQKSLYQIYMLIKLIDSSVLKKFIPHWDTDPLVFVKSQDSIGSSFFLTVYHPVLVYVFPHTFQIFSLLCFISIFDNTETSSKGKVGLLRNSFLVHGLDCFYQTLSCSHFKIPNWNFPFIYWLGT